MMFTQEDVIKEAIKLARKRKYITKKYSVYMYSIEEIIKQLKS